MRFLDKISEKKIELLLVLIIILAGSFLRVYKFSDWLHFEIDQVYDIDSISLAVDNGIENLPLLGTNAGGGTLRLGPAFYYLEYLSAKIFGNTPVGHATFVLILSLLSLPLFYFFSRQYFSPKISIPLLAVFSFSVYLIQYSRFSWSPNILPFFILLSFYSLLRSVSEKEKRKSFWFLLSVTAITICTQIHFNSLLVVPSIAIIFLLIKRPRFPLKTWFLALAIILVIYSPMIINEIKTNAQNSRYFIQKISKNTREKNIWRDALSKTLHYNAMEFSLIISGKDFINNQQSGKFANCQECSTSKLLKISSWLYFFTGLFSMIYLLRKNRDTEKNDFLVISTLWFVISFGLFLYLIEGNYSMQPRFAIISAPLAILFLGFLAKALKAEKGFRFFIFLGTIIILLSINAMRMKDIFSQLSRIDKENIRVEQEDIFPVAGRVTLSQQYEIINYLKSKFSQNNYPVYLESNKSEYEATFWYHLNKIGIRYYGPINSDALCQKANYFIIKTNPEPREIIKFFDVAEKKDFGSLIVFCLTPKKEKVACQELSDLKQYLTDPEKKAQEMLTWKNAFSKN